MDELLKEAFNIDVDTSNKRYEKEDVRISPSLPISYGTTKSGQLIDFFHSKEDLAPQGSEEWLLARMKCVGGSEIGAITGNNKHMKVEDLILSKAGIKPFKPNHFMLWGTMFEDILRKTVEKIYNVKILETGSVVGEYGNAYSPDGVCYHPKEDKIILYEFKCPFSREPDGVVPPHYKDQVLLGLDTLNVCDEGRYIEAVIRRCSMEDIGFNTNYDNIILHKNIEYKTPIAYGFIGFFTSCDYMYGAKDIGNCERKLFIQIMYRIINGDIDYYQFDPIVNPTISQEKNKETFYEQINKFYNFCNMRGLTVVGVMPYKIFPFEIHRIQKEKDFAKNLAPKIKEVLDKVQEIREFENTKKYKNYRKKPN